MAAPYGYNTAANTNANFSNEPYGYSDPFKNPETERLDSSQPAPAYNDPNYSRAAGSQQPYQNDHFQIPEGEKKPVMLTPKERKRLVRIHWFWLIFAILINAIVIAITVVQVLRATNNQDAYYYR